MSAYRRLEVQLPQFWRREQAEAAASTARARQAQAESEGAEAARRDAEERWRQKLSSLTTVGPPEALRGLEETLQSFWSDQWSLWGDTGGPVGVMGQATCAAFAKGVVAEFQGLRGDAAAAEQEVAAAQGAVADANAKLKLVEGASPAVKTAVAVAKGALTKAKREAQEAEKRLQAECELDSKPPVLDLCTIPLCFHP
jgi:hypothetical protein